MFGKPRASRERAAYEAYQFRCTRTTVARSAFIYCKQGRSFTQVQFLVCVCVYKGLRPPAHVRRINKTQRKVRALWLIQGQEKRWKTGKIVRLYTSASVVSWIRKLWSSQMFTISQVKPIFWKYVVRVWNFDIHLLEIFYFFPI